MSLTVPSFLRFSLCNLGNLSQTIVQIGSFLDKEQKDRIVAAHHADHKWRKTRKCLYVNSNLACSIIKTESCFDSKGACSSCIQQKTRQRALSDDRVIVGSLRSLKLTLSTLLSAIKPVRSCSLHFLIHAAQVLLLFLSLRVTGCIW